MTHPISLRELDTFKNEKQIVSLLSPYSSGMHPALCRDH